MGNVNLPLNDFANLEIFFSSAKNITNPPSPAPNILAPTAPAVRKTKTVEWNLNSPLVWVTYLRFETALGGI